MLMACPEARLLRLTPRELAPVVFTETDHFRMLREFCADPASFVQAALEE